MVVIALSLYGGTNSGEEKKNASTYDYLYVKKSPFNKADIMREKNLKTNTEMYKSIRSHIYVCMNVNL